MKLFKWVLKYRRILLWCWTGMLLTATLLPGNAFPEVPDWTNLFQPDKLMHLALFSGLMFFLLFNIQRYTCRSNIFICFLTGFVFCCVTELLQGFLPINRQMSIFDAIANIAGLLLGFLFWRIAAKKINK